MCFVIFVPLVGKNGIENNTEDSRAGKTAELEVCAADCELNGVGLEAKTAYENNRRDKKVAGFREVNFVFNFFR